MAPMDSSKHSASYQMMDEPRLSSHHNRLAHQRGSCFEQCGPYYEDLDNLTTAPLAALPSLTGVSSFVPESIGRQFEDVYEFVDGGTCGSGSSANVYQIRRRSDGRKFACKVFDCNGKEKLEQAINEAETMKALESSGDCRTGSSCIATCKDVFVRRTAPGRHRCRLYLVTDLMRGGHLREALEHRGSYTEEDSRTVMKQLLQALAFIHDAGVTHRDVKMENILLPSQLDPTNIKLFDFGFSATGTSSSPTMDRRCGSPFYVAPEILDRTGCYGNKVDIWSSGVVLFELLCGYPPYYDGHATTVREVLRAIRMVQPNMADPAWELVSGEARDLVQKLLTKNPKERLSAREALLHPWMLGIDARHPHQ